MLTLVLRMLIQVKSPKMLHINFENILYAGRLMNL